MSKAVDKGVDNRLILCYDGDIKGGAFSPPKPLHNMKDTSYDQIADDHKALKDFMAKYPRNGHEPDGWKAVVKGNHLDNAMGNSGSCGEKVIVITDPDGKTIQFALSTVLAFAAK